MSKNAIVGQSGGPTTVINSSLAGVFQACQRRGIDCVYGMRNGIQGLLAGEVVDLMQKFPTSLEIELLKRTPSSYLGSCRYKLPAIDDDESVYQTIFRILDELKIDFFFYIGGNDSMDTICKLSEYARRINSPIKFMGVPKTIDNDLMITDHTPGYGSAAKYIGITMKELIRDATVYNTRPSVTIVEVMGRNAGWLTASAALARDEDCEGVDIIALPEIPFEIDRFIAQVEEKQKEKKALVIAVSEGIRLADGRYVCELGEDVTTTDAFGHKSLTGTARYLSNCVSSALNTKVRAIELSTLQRCAGHISSRTDITEAYQAGGAAVKAAFEGHTGEMIALKRVSDDPYQCTTEAHDVRKVANLEKKIPLEWINEDRTGLLPAFDRYARPLIQGELPPFYIDGLPRHIYLK